MGYPVLNSKLQDLGCNQLLVQLLAKKSHPTPKWQSRIYHQGHLPQHPESTPQPSSWPWHHIMGCYPFPTVTPESLSSSVCIPITEYRRQGSFQVTEIYSYCFDGCKILVHEAQLSCAPAALASNTVPYCFVPQRRGMLCPHVRQCVKDSRGISFIKLGISQGTQYHSSSLPFLDLTAMLKHSNHGSTDPIHRVRSYAPPSVKTI